LTTKLAVIGLLLAVPAGFAQAPVQVGGKPSFEVVSVKINKSGDRRSSIQLGNPDSFIATNLGLPSLISAAYEVPPGKLSGGPAWIASERFDITAKAEGRISLDTKMQMLWSLLEDRFKLKIRIDTKEGQIYALVMARADRRLGPNIRPSSPECVAAIEARSRFDASPPPPPKPGEQPACSGIPGVQGNYRFNGRKMSEFAVSLGAIMRQTVVDRTGLDGRFDIAFSASLDELVPSPRAVGAGDPERPPSVFTALQEQLGLKLDAQRGQVETFVIDRVELPTED